MDFLEFISETLEGLKNRSAYRTLYVKEEGFTPYSVYAGARYIDFSSNDYLALSSNQLLKEKLATRLLQHQMGATGSRLLSGNHALFEELEIAINQLFNHSSSLLFNSGYQLNVGVIPTLFSKNDLIIADKYTHASLIDGIRLSGAKFLRFNHLDYEHLKRLLQKQRSSYNYALLVTESVFSMDGDQSNLEELQRIATHYNAQLMVDEAHAFGVLGPQGAGLCARLTKQPQYIVATFGKALGSCGAFILCDPLIREYLINHCRSFIYSTALALPVLLWNLDVLKELPNLEVQRKHLSHLGTYLREGIQRKGYKTLGNTHIVPLMLSSNDNALKKSADLKSKGYLASAIRHPTVARGSERLRFSLSSAHTFEQLDQLINVL
jgi:8-amino-7-oxononanoate synthase